MSKTNIISDYCKIRGNKIIINDNTEFFEENYSNFGNFIKTIYKSTQINYPKFYKMDDLCKLAFVTSELILKCNNLSNKYKPDEISVIISNSCSTIETDTNYYNTIKDNSNYFPSPSVFVYTLPNITIGEVCIKNHFMGENIFFISEKFDSEFISSYVNNILDNNKAQACICGWVEYNKDNYESFLYIAEKNTDENNNKLIHNANNVKQLYLK